MGLNSDDSGSICLRGSAFGGLIGAAGLFEKAAELAGELMNSKVSTASCSARVGVEVICEPCFCAASEFDGIGGGWRHAVAERLP